jgi:hypothetical protein
MMAEKKSTTPKVPKVPIPEKAAVSNKFPPRVIALAKQTGKTPLHFWFEEKGTILAIQWTDFSKDRYPAE